MYAGMERQTRMNDKIRQRNSHEDRVLSQNLRRKHGLENVKLHHTKSVEREIRDVQREFDKMRAYAVASRRRISSSEYVMKCRRPSVPSSKQRSKSVAVATSTDVNSGRNSSGTTTTRQAVGDLNDTPRDSIHTDLGQREKIEEANKAVINVSLNNSRREEKNSLNPVTDINHSLSRNSDIPHLSGYEFILGVGKPQLNRNSAVEFVEEDEISYKTDPRKGRFSQSWNNLHSIPVPAPSLSAESPTYYNSARDSHVEEPDLSELLVTSPISRRRSVTDFGFKQDYVSTYVTPRGETAHLLTLSSGLLAMATANNNFVRSQSVDYGSDASSLIGDAQSESIDGSRVNKGRRGSSKVSDLLRQTKFDRDRYNPDGSIRTVHKLPDFNKSYEQARRARYIRSKEALERDKELTSKEIFQSPAANFGIQK